MKPTFYQKSQKLEPASTAYHTVFFNISRLVSASKELVKKTVDEDISGVKYTIYIFG